MEKEVLGHYAVDQDGGGLQILIIHPSGEVGSQILPKDFGQRLRVLKDLVGGHLEAVPVPGANYLVAWEGAKGATHFVNKKATDMAREAGSIQPSDYFAGTVLVVPQAALR